MRLLLHDVPLELLSSAAAVRAGWGAIFDRELALAARRPPPPPALQLRAEIVPALSPPAAAGSQSSTCFSDGDGPVHVTVPDDGRDTLCLRLARPAQITYRFNAAVPQAHIQLTRAILDTHNLEDITLIALAPLLRRRGLFFIHAFAAAAGAKAALFVGPSGSGKTTTGLALLGAGWRFLANDAALLVEQPSGIWALPSPGPLNIHPQTLDLLPELRGWAGMQEAPAAQKVTLPRERALTEGQFAAAAPVTAVFFPTLAPAGPGSAREIPAAVGLARLLEQSVDQWDLATLEAHLELLARLSAQARFYDLLIPRSRRPDPGLLQALL
jgi:hypothetical protein